MVLPSLQSTEMKPQWLYKKKQNKTICRWKVQALWLQSQKPSTLLHIEESQANTNIPCLQKVFSQSGRSSLWEDASFAPFVSASLSAMLRTDIKLQRLKTGYTGKQTVRRGRKK